MILLLFFVLFCSFCMPRPTLFKLGVRWKPCSPKRAGSLHCSSLQRASRWLWERRIRPGPPGKRRSARSSKQFKTASAHVRQISPRARHSRRSWKMISVRTLQKPGCTFHVSCKGWSAGAIAGRRRAKLQTTWSWRLPLAAPLAAAATPRIIALRNISRVYIVFPKTDRCMTAPWHTVRVWRLVFGNIHGANCLETGV